MLKNAWTIADRWIKYKNYIRAVGDYPDEVRSVAESTSAQWFGVNSGGPQIQQLPHCARVVFLLISRLPAFHAVPRDINLAQRAHQREPATKEHRWFPRIRN
jgi:hypothetical protein